MNCCSEVVSAIKIKFDLMASLALVGAAYLLVGIKMALYLSRKLGKFKTKVLSHRNDSYLLAAILVTLIMVLTAQIAV
jgi:hypothetical protein